MDRLLKRALRIYLFDPSTPRPQLVFPFGGHVNQLLKTVLVIIFISLFRINHNLSFLDIKRRYLCKYVYIYSELTHPKANKICPKSRASRLTEADKRNTTVPFRNEIVSCSTRFGWYSVRPMKKQIE